jgi:hypothetical protein
LFFAGRFLFTDASHVARTSLRRISLSDGTCVPGRLRGDHWFGSAARAGDLVWMLQGRGVSEAAVYAWPDLDRAIAPAMAVDLELGVGYSPDRFAELVPGRPAAPDTRGTLAITPPGLTLRDFALRRSMTVTDYGQWPRGSLAHTGDRVRFVLGGEPHRIDIDRSVPSVPRTDKASADTMIRKLRVNELGAEPVWHPIVDAVFLPLRPNTASPRPWRLAWLGNGDALELAPELTPVQWTRDGLSLLVRRSSVREKPTLEVWA